MRFRIDAYSERLQRGIVVVSEGHIGDYQCDCPEKHPLPPFDAIVAEKYMVLMNVLYSMGSFDNLPSDVVWTGNMDTAVCTN